MKCLFCETETKQDKNRNSCPNCKMSFLKPMEMKTLVRLLRFTSCMKKGGCYEISRSNSKD